MVQPRIYASDAEKMRAYRARKKAKRNASNVTPKRNAVNKPNVTRPSVTVPSKRNAPREEKGWGGRKGTWSDEDGRTAIRLDRAARRELGPKATTKQILDHIRPRLPVTIRNSSPETFYSGLRRAVEALPPWYDRCVSLMRSWGGYRYDEDADGPHKFVDDFVTVAGPFAFQIPERFERLEQQTGDGNAKYKRAVKLFEKIKHNPADWGVRPKPAYRSDEISAAILDFINRHPKQRILLGWSVSDLASQDFARELGISIKAMTHHTKRMRDRRPAELEWADVGQCLVRPAGTGGPIRKPCTTQGLEKLFALPDHKMEVYALTEAVGAASLMWVNTLRRNDLVYYLDLRRGTMVELTSKAVTMMTTGQTIRDGRRAPLWQPDANLTKHRQT